MGAGYVSVRTDHGCCGALPTRGAGGLNIVAIVGHTASGKSEVAEAVAMRYGAEIVSVDSMQVYRGMDIGTAKPSPATQERIPHHMIDVADPADDYSVREFQERGRAVLGVLAESGSRAVIVGGSGLHFRSLVDPLEFSPTDPGVRERLNETDPVVARDRLLRVDPEAGAHVDLANHRRVVRALEIHELTGLTPTQRAKSVAASAVRGYEPEHAHVSIGFDAGDLSHTRIESRWNAMLDAGLLDEVARLAPDLGPTASQAVGYKQLAPVVTGDTSLEEGTEQALVATRALVRRQRTYFGRDPRIAWQPWHDDPQQRIAATIDHIEREASWTS